MLYSETNSNTQTQQDDLALSKMMQDPSNAELIDNPQAQKKKLSGLLAQSIKDFSTWPTGKQVLAVSAAGGLLATVLPLLLAAVPLAATGAMIGLALFFSVKAVQSGYKGLKWSAEKTVEGAKHIGEKVKDVYEYSVDSLKRGTSRTLDRSGSFLKNVAHSGDYSMKSEFVQKLLAQEGIKDVVNSTIEITKANNFSVPSKIKSAIRSKLSSEVKAACKDHSLDAKNNLEKQSKMVDQLDQVLKKSMLDAKELELVTKIFSKCQSEIKEAIREFKFDQSVKSNNAKDVEERKVSKSFSLSSSSFSLKRKNSEQSSRLSKSSSMDSVRTNSTISSEAELSNSGEHKKVKTPTSLSGGLFSSSKGSRKTEKVICTGYRSLPENDMQSTEMDNSTSYVAPPKPPRSNSTGSISTESTATVASFTSDRRSSDSGFNSPSSSPQHRMFSKENGELKTQADLRRTGSLEDLINPSSKLTVDTEVEPKAPKTKIK